MTALSVNYSALYPVGTLPAAPPQPPVAPPRALPRPRPAPPASPASDPLAAPDAVAAEIHDGQATVYDSDGKGHIRPEAGAGTPSLSAPGRIRQFIHRIFLPANYPSGVASDYMPYRRWCAVANVANSAVDFFATQGVLAGLGLQVGPAVVATLSYYVKDAFDGFGQIVGGVLARKADVDPKKWYVRDQAIQDVARLAQTGLLVVPGSFLVVAPLTNAVKAFGSTIDGAATANIDNHQAQGQNVGDLKAKNGNQNLVSNGLGSVLGVALSMALPNAIGPWVDVAASAALTGVGIVAARKAAATLQMNDLTADNLRRLAHQQLLADRICTPSQLDGDHGMRKLPHGMPEVELGTGIGDMVGDAARFDRLRALAAGDRYLLDFDGKKIRIALGESSDVQDQAKALYQAELVAELAVSPGYAKLVARLGADRAALQAVAYAHRAAPADFKSYLVALQQQGWETSRIHTQPGKLRAVWKPLPAAASPPMSLADFRALMQ